MSDTVCTKWFGCLLSSLLAVWFTLGHDPKQLQAADPQLIVLGIAQDGGYPQAGCDRDCCQPAWQVPSRRRYSSCLAVVDPESKQRWLFDCTPDFRDQLRLLDSQTTEWLPEKLIDGICLTHAHVGHYAGLMHLGREVLGTDSVAVHAMPRMQYFLESNGPWSQLVDLRQIEIHRLAAGSTTQLNERISITPFLVPHRDEFSETVGFRIEGPKRQAIYLPDIDKWQRWEVDINRMIQEADLAFLDGTFFDGSELPNRDMTEIPHPFIVESIQRFSNLTENDRRKIHFLHLNHTNPLLNEDSHQRSVLVEAKMNVALQGSRFDL